MSNKPLCLACFIILLALAAFPSQATLAVNPEQPEAPAGEIGYLSVPAAAFVPVDFDHNFQNHGRYLQNGTFEEGYFRASVILPYGATIRRFTACFGAIGDSIGWVRLFSKLIQYNDIPTQHLQLMSIPSGGFHTVTATNIYDPEYTTNSYYWIEVQLPTWPDYVRFCGATIEYSKPASRPTEINIPGAAFRPNRWGYNGGADEEQSWGSLHHYSSSGGGTANGIYLAPLDLPDGAQISLFQLYYYDDPPTSTSAHVYLMRSNHTGVNEFLASFTTTSSDSVLSTGAIANPLVDNENYSYWMYADMPVWSLGHISGVKIGFLPPAHDGGVVAVPNAALTSFDDALDFQNHGRWMFHIAGESGALDPGTYVAPVYLPQGVEITSIKYTFYDGDSGASHNGEGALARTSLGDHYEMSRQVTSGAPGYASLIDNSILEDVVDNTLYNYYAYFTLPISTPPDPLGSDDVVGVKFTIYYTPNFPVYLPVVVR